MADDDAFVPWFDETVRPPRAIAGETCEGYRTFFRGLFDDAGPVDHATAWTSFELARIATTEEALGLVLDDVAHFWDREPEISVDSYDTAIRVTVDNGYLQPSIDAFPGEVGHAAVQLVTYLREELDGDDTVHWPACSKHRWTSLQATMSGDKAVWLCPAGDHVLARVGELRRFTR